MTTGTMTFIPPTRPPRAAVDNALALLARGAVRDAYDEAQKDIGEKMVFPTSDLVAQYLYESGSVECVDNAVRKAVEAVLTAGKKK